MLQRDFRAGFKIEHQSKDLRYALDTASDLAATLPGTMLVRDLFASAEEDGLGGEGTQALVKALEKLSAVTIGG